MLQFLLKLLRRCNLKNFAHNKGCQHDDTDAHNNNSNRTFLPPLSVVLNGEFARSSKSVSNALTNRRVTWQMARDTTREVIRVSHGRSSEVLL
jgi:hypothetical protein